MGGFFLGGRHSDFLIVNLHTEILLRFLRSPEIRILLNTLMFYA